MGKKVGVLQLARKQKGYPTSGTAFCCMKENRLNYCG
jgi:hypothetical protein